MALKIALHELGNRTSIFAILYEVVDANLRLWLLSLLTTLALIAKS